MISPNLSTAHLPSPPSAASVNKSISALLSSPASSTSSSEEANLRASSPALAAAATHLAEKVQAAAAELEKSKAAAIKMSNFSIAALINKDSEAELERRRRLVESVPMLGKNREGFLQK